MPVRFRNIITVAAPILALGIALTIVPGKAEANAALAVFFQSNVPIITVPPTTPPPVGVPGTVESPVPVNPDPGPPDLDGTTPEVQASVQRSKGKHEGGEKLYVYIVLQKDYQKDGKINKATPGIIGANWIPVKRMEKSGFRFKLTSASAGNEYYVVGVRKLKGGKLEYTSKHPVRIERL